MKKLLLSLIVVLAIVACEKQKDEPDQLKIKSITINDHLIYSFEYTGYLLTSYKHYDFLTDDGDYIPITYHLNYDSDDKLRSLSSEPFDTVFPSGGSLHYLGSSISYSYNPEGYFCGNIISPTDGSFLSDGRVENDIRTNIQRYFYYDENKNLYQYEYFYNSSLNESVYLEYDDKSNPFNLFFPYFHIIDFPVTWFDFICLSPNNPTHITEKGDPQYSFTYEYNSSGYPTKCTTSFKAVRYQAETLIYEFEYY